MTTCARVFVTLKNGVLDPQGDAVLQALKSQGFSGVQEVRVGKVIDVMLDESSHGDVQHRLAQMADKLLANPVIENYRVEMIDSSSRSRS